MWKSVVLIKHFFDLLDLNEVIAKTLRDNLI